MATKQYLSKVCFAFLSLIVAFVIALIFWLCQSHQELSTTSPFHNSDLEDLDFKMAENTCLVEPLVGDGYCDDEANNAECDYDLDDCCQLESDRNSCTNCTCLVDNDQLVKIQDDFCQTPYDALNYDLGDGFCDLDLNTKEYFFDIGDCCLQDRICVKDELVGTFTYFTYIKTEVTCPDNPCIESNQYCIEHELGDGICQDHNNGPYCDYDLGDCCSGSGEGFDHCCTCACRHYHFPLDHFHLLG